MMAERERERQLSVLLDPFLLLLLLSSPTLDVLGAGSVGQVIQFLFLRYHDVATRERARPSWVVFVIRTQ